jgi:hypothetical protein
MLDKLAIRVTERVKAQLEDQYIPKNARKGPVSAAQEQ